MAQCVKGSSFDLYYHPNRVITAHSHHHHDGVHNALWQYNPAPKSSAAYSKNALNLISLLHKNIRIRRSARFVFLQNVQIHCPNIPPQN